MSQPIDSTGKAVLHIGQHLLKSLLTEGIVVDAAFVAMLAVLAWQQPAPTEALITQFLNGFTTFMSMGLLGLVAYGAAQYVLNRWTYPRFQKVCLRFTTGALAMIFATKVCGDALIHWAERFPDFAVLVAVLLAFTLLILRYALGIEPPRPAPLTLTSESSTTIQHSSLRVPRPSPRDVKLLSVHEAAHALLFAAWPAGVLTGVNIRPEFCRGTVNYELPHLSRNTQEVKFELLGHLAGRAGEQATFQTKFLGAENDLQHYSTRATQYLGFDDLDEGHSLIPAPMTQEEVAFNAEALRQLRLKHYGVLDEFFRVNQDVLADLAALIRERQTLDGPSVQPYLERVVLTTGIPVFEGAVGQRREEEA